MIETLIIFVLVFAFYANTFHYGLIVDDLFWRKEVKTLAKRINPFDLLQTRLYGGCTFGKSVLVDHVFQTFLHAVICVLMYFAFGANNISFFAAILYAFNPANNQTAMWINSRRYAVNIILVLAMLLIGPLGLFLYPLTGLFQVNAIFSFILFGPVGLLALPLALILFPYWKKLHEVFRNRYSIVPEGAKKQYGLSRITVAVKTYGYYFFKMIFPGRCLFYDKFLYFWGITKEGDRDAYSVNLDFLKGVLALAISAVGLFYFKDKMFWMFLFMCVSILQWSNIVTATMTVADRYMSLPNVFMMFFVSYLLNTFLGGYAIYLIIALAIHYSSTTSIAKSMYKDIFSFWRYHIYFDPAGVSARSFYVSELILNKDFISALSMAQDGLKYRPNDFKFLFQAAVCLRQFGNSENAIKYLDKAEKNLYLGQEERLMGLVSKIREAINKELMPSRQVRRQKERELAKA